MKKTTLLTVFALSQVFFFPGTLHCDPDYTGQIFFSNYDIYVLDPLTEEVSPPIVTDNQGWFDVSWDGSQIIYLCLDYDGQTWCLSRPDGTGRCKLPQWVFGESCWGDPPAFSPTNRQLALSLLSGGTCKIFVADYFYDGENCGIENLTQLTEPQTHQRISDEYPHWSADGQFVVFSGYKLYEGFQDGLATVFKVAAVGGEDAYLADLSRFTPEEIDVGTSEYFARYKPDGERIVFWRWRDSTEPSSLVTMDDDGGSEQVVYEDLSIGPCNGPTYSPNGDYISFIAVDLCPEQGGYPKVFAIPESGGPVDEMTNCEDPPAYCQVWAPTDPPVEVIDVAFDFENGSSDGQDIRINLDEDVCTINANNCSDNRGEWVKGVRSHPAALLSTAYDSEYHPGPMRVQARFEIKPGWGQIATVSADSPVFGNFGEQQVTFGAGGKSDWIEFTTSGVRPAGVALFDDHIQWKVKDIAGVPSDWININKSTHRIYFVLAPGNPIYPFQGEPFENQHEPWADVLAYSAKWAAGQSEYRGVAEEMTKCLYDLGGLYYDVNGIANYAVIPGGPPPWNFRLKKFLRDWSSPTAFKWVNCQDMGMAIAIFASSLGGPCDFRWVEPDPNHPNRPGYPVEHSFVVNFIDPIGFECDHATPGWQSTCPTNNPFWWLHDWLHDPVWAPITPGDAYRKGGFNRHAFASLNEPGGEKAYDATAMIDIDSDPDDEPGNFAYVLGCSLNARKMYGGLIDWNDVPKSDPYSGGKSPFRVNNPQE